MKAKISKPTIYIFLYILLFISLVMTFAMFIMGVANLINEFDYSNIINLFTTTIYAFNYFLVVVYLLKIVDSTDISPFIHKNVSRFKLMGYCLLINSIFEFIIGWNSGPSKIIVLIGHDNGGLTPLIVAIFISSLMCFIMAEVFDRAIKIKEDNELTI